MKIELERNVGKVRYLRVGALHVWRFQRSARLTTEVHTHGGVRYVNLTVGHPRRHARWAFTAYLYLPAWFPGLRRPSMRTWLR